MKNNDFQISLVRFINGLNLPLTARLDYLSENADLVVYPLPGGKITMEYMDGRQEMLLPFEIAVKLKDQELANAIMWRLNESLSAFDLEIASQNGTYDFIGLTTQKPFVNGKDDQGYFIYLLDLEARLEIGGTN